MDVRLPANRYVLFFSLAIVGVSIDLLTKSYVFANFFDPRLAAMDRPQAVHWWVDGVFGLQASTNPGALFGIGKGYSFVFAMISVLAIVGILVWLFYFKQAFDRWMTFALGMITGGILGNLYDRLGFGYDPSFPVSIRDNVRDFILFRLQDVPMFDPWPNFNIADSLLVCGAAMLFFHAFFAKPAVPPQEEPGAAN